MRLRPASVVSTAKPAAATLALPASGETAEAWLSTQGARALSLVGEAAASSQCHSELAVLVEARRGARMLSQRAMSTRSLNAAISNAASVGVGRVAPLNASNGSSSPHRLKTGSQDHPHHPAEAHSARKLSRT